MSDSVNHPNYYNTGKTEVIEVIKDQLGKEGLRGFCLGSACKYIMRAGKKDPEKEAEDLRKAAWYLLYYAEEVSNNANKN